MTEHIDCKQEETIGKLWEKISSSTGVRWQIAFWVIAGVFIPMLAFYGTNLIANDKMRVDGDTKIAALVEERNAVINEKLTAILQDVRELKTLMSMKNESVSRLSAHRTPAA